jgi:hypothetical protein
MRLTKPFGDRHGDAVMLAVTPLLDRDLGLGHPVCLHEADVSSQTVTGRQRRTTRYPPICAADRVPCRPVGAARERVI